MKWFWIMSIDAALIKSCWYMLLKTLIFASDKRKCSSKINELCPGVASLTPNIVGKCYRGTNIWLLNFTIWHQFLKMNDVTWNSIHHFQCRLCAPSLHKSIFLDCKQIFLHTVHDRFTNATQFTVLFHFKRFVENR